MDTWLWILIVVGAVVVVAAAVTMFVLRHRRRQGLRDRFGPEYDRRVDGAKSRRKAEGDLAGTGDAADDGGGPPGGDVQDTDGVLAAGDRERPSVGAEGQRPGASGGPARVRTCARDATSQSTILLS